MPIKPENRHRYPTNWKTIRAHILWRAKGRCERCGAINGDRIARGAGPDADTYQTSDAQVWDANTGNSLGWRHMADYNVDRMVTIVLTIAHLDHQPENCADNNLQALCQRCHLRHDQQHHIESARATRRGRLAVADLFNRQGDAS